MSQNILANTLEQEGILVDEHVAQAFRAVPRHMFLPEFDQASVYLDKAFYTTTDRRGGFLSGSDQPSQMVKMLNIARLEPGQNVLEIGTGTGYNAALLQNIVGDSGNVTSLEISREVFKSAMDNLQRISVGSRINVVNADGAMGYSARSSYDRIISTVAVWDIPPAWVRQLRPGGLIVAPLFIDGLQICVAFRVEDNGTLIGEYAHSCSFVEVQGMEGSSPQYMYLGGGSALRLYSNEINEIDSASLHTLLSNDAESCHLGVAPSNQDYWDGFIPYMMINVPDGYDFVCFIVEGDKIVYGLTGNGFGLVAHSSTVMVCADELGRTHCYAGVDAFLEVDAGYNNWVKAGSPRTDKLQLQLLPKTDVAPDGEGLMLERRYHHLHVWLDSGDTTNGERS